ncbi:MAG: PAS domain S-box protein [Bacteroidales bacterium]|nr:PAS domain S-box protein [Bacteroidales bacterium]MBN2757876.1 PAS domain S-box protein [Bacteroidales bacterium]
MNKYNELLISQLKKHLGNNYKLPKELKALFDEINSSYENFEKNEKLLEKSIDFRSNELLDVNKKLLLESEKQNNFIQKLTQTVYEIGDYQTFINELQLYNDDFDYLFDYLKSKIIQSKQSQNQLVESESNLLALIENSKDAIWSINKNHEIIIYNTAFEKKIEWAYKIKPESGKHFKDIVSKKHYLFWEKLMNRALLGNHFIEEISYKIAGIKYYFEISLNPIIINDIIEGVSIFSRDVSHNKKIENDLCKAKEELEAKVLQRTEELLIANLSLKKEITARKKTEKALIEAKNKAEESDRLKTAFLANMSHEIRTPLNAIVGFSSLLSDNEVDEEVRDFYIKNIDEGSESLTQLIDNIIDIAKIEAKQLSIQKTDFFVNDILTELFYKFKDSLLNTKSKFLEFLIDIPYKSVDFVINADKKRFRQILINLLSNAFKFTEKGEVTIGYSIKDENLMFFVKDTGIGIDQSSHDTIFNRFIKLEEDKNKLFRGTGIGLAIVKGLAEYLDLKIKIKSEKNIGSCFSFEIPFKYQVEKSDNEMINEKNN